MSDDPYKVLGVAKTATQDEIKTAYRKLAKTLHPDLNPDDPAKQAEFQAVSAAYDLLGDPEKRRRFDAGEIDASARSARSTSIITATRHRTAGNATTAASAGLVRDVLFGPVSVRGRVSDRSGRVLLRSVADLFGRRRHGESSPGEEFEARGHDMRYHLRSASWMRLWAQSARDDAGWQGIEITIPSGVPRWTDAPPPRPRRAGTRQRDRQAMRSLRSPLPLPGLHTRRRHHRTGTAVTFDEAVLGAKVDVPTIPGPSP